MGLSGRGRLSKGIGISSWFVDGGDGRLRRPARTPGPLSKLTKMEVNMTHKIIAAVAVALLLGSTGIASAQTNTHAARVNGVSQAPLTYSYYNEDYWRAIAPKGALNSGIPMQGPSRKALRPTESRL
jgi:hypothetical protein